MKKMIIGLMISFVFLFSLNVKASSTNDTLVSAGITPDSPFYGLDRFFEKVSYFFTFSDEKRIEKLSRFSEERLAEMNKMKNKKNNQEDIDNLFDDYGSNLNKANNLLSKVIAKGKLKDSKIEKLQDLLASTSNKEALVSSDVKSKINDEVKSRVKEIKIQLLLTSLSNKIPEEDNNDLKGYGNGVKVRLYALSKITGLSINDILDLDIYLPDDPTTPQVEKNIDFNKLQTVLNLDKDQLIETLKEYHQNMMEERENHTPGQGNGSGNSNGGNYGENSSNHKSEQEEQNEQRQQQIKKAIEDHLKGKENDDD